MKNEKFDWRKIVFPGIAIAFLIAIILMTNLNG